MNQYRVVKIKNTVRKYRLKNKLRWIDVEKAAGVTHGTIWQWENQICHPGPKTAPKLAKLFGIDVKKLYVVSRL